MLKGFLKERFLDLGLYYQINGYRFRNDQRNASQKEFYGQLIGKDDLVFDIGANVGQRSEIFSQLARQVIAFEPQPDCVRHLKSRFRRTPNVTINQLAVSDSEGEATFFKSDSHTLSSMSPEFISKVSAHRFKESHWNEQLVVTTTTLDHMIARYGVPRFIKIDVEGFEANVLKGLTQPVSYISFEMTPELIEQSQECVRLLNSISPDYVFNYCVGEDLNFVLKEHADYEEFTGHILPKLGKQGHFGDIYAVLSQSKNARASAVTS
ncbi:MAG TPA: FkbM family methyltransferase [Pyrinomonadaceae bacterium]|nr:FkbM family methyltransferase [Pyrinomonadaceae bacterium]